MGVAGLFSFLRRRYPEIVETCAQQAHELAEGETACDNLYIDLNHIIHACTHPSWREEAHASELEQFMECDVYLDRLVALMRPTRLLLVAADGSAPAAKMNQQRGRRFYAAHLERQRRDIEAQVRREMTAEMGPLGGAAIPALPDFDGNVITPGTGFMARLGDHLRQFFRQKLESDPGWAHLAVIFSDSSEPGEGEHKIMRFIRQQRTRPDYDPNTSHAIYGQDADLILLGLLSHEPHFCILREAGTLEAVLEGARDAGDEGAPDMWSPVGQQPLELLRLSTLRDFLRCEFAEFCDRQKKPPPAAAALPPPAAAAVAGAGGTTAGAAEAAEDAGGGCSQSGPSSTASSLDGQEAEEASRSSQGGQVDPITGEPRRVHPRAARRHAKRQQREAAAATAAAPAPAGTGAGGSSGTGSNVGSKPAPAGCSLDFERILDDVVFCTFLAGNDFLPHVPSLDIYDRPSALETLLDKYKEMLSSGPGYLTASGRVDPGKLCWLFQRLAGEEEATFQQRELRKVREQRRKQQQEAAGGQGGQERERQGGASWMGGGEWISVGELGAGESLDEVLAGAGSGGGRDLPAAVLWADDPARLRRELLKRIRSRMDDRAQAGMAADRVRFSLAGYRGRYYQRCFGAEAAGGPELEKAVRRVCEAYCRTLCWVALYYTTGTPPAPPPNHNGCLAAPGSEQAAAAPGRAQRRGGGDGDAAPYAAWQVLYEYHYAPLASDLAKYGREELRGAEAAASRHDAPIPPFAQLLSVLPFSSMPACLPKPLAAAAGHPSEGLAALHGPAGQAVFPEDVAPLVDLSGKKWAHTAVVALPFPDVSAICSFVAEQLEDTEGCRLSDAERARNCFAPALLLLPACHPLAQQAQQALSASSAGSVGSGRGTQCKELLQAPLGEQQADQPALEPAAENSIQECLALPAEPAEGCSILSLLLPAHQQATTCGNAPGVLCLAVDIAGQEVPPFSPGLLPGTREGERAVTLQSWNKRRLGEQRRQAAHAAAGLRGGRGRGRDSTSRGSGRGPGGRFAAGVQPAVSARRQQELSDEELARRLQEQFYAEARAERIAAADGASRSSDSHGTVAAAGPNPPGPEAGWGGALQEAGSRAGRGTSAAAPQIGTSAPATTASAAAASGVGAEEELEDMLALLGVQQ
ncbi:hypothetical protein ABPG77_004029 [Micractinium sp. CCAP 211/92]